MQNSQPFPLPTEPVTIDLGDGKQRRLRYNLAAMRRLHAKFGTSVLNGELFKAMDENSIPELIFEGLMDRDGIADADALAEILHPRAVPYLLEKFLEAFTGALPEGVDPNAKMSRAN